MEKGLRGWGILQAAYPLFPKWALVSIGDLYSWIIRGQTEIVQHRNSLQFFRHERKQGKSKEKRIAFVAERRELIWFETNCTGTGVLLSLFTLRYSTKKLIPPTALMLHLDIYH